MRVFSSITWQIDHFLIKAPAVVFVHQKRGISSSWLPNSQLLEDPRHFLAMLWPIQPKSRWRNSTTICLMNYDVWRCIVDRNVTNEDWETNTSLRLGKTSTGDLRSRSDWYCKYQRNARLDVLLFYVASWSTIIYGGYSSISFFFLFIIRDLRVHSGPKFACYPLGYGYTLERINFVVELS